LWGAVGRKKGPGWKRRLGVLMTMSGLDFSI